MRSIGPMEILVILCVAFIVVPVVVIPYWKIFSKAGFAGPISLLMLIPLVNLVTLYVVAFSEWPVLRQLNTSRQGQS